MAKKIKRLTIDGFIKMFARAVKKADATFIVQGEGTLRTKQTGPMGFCQCPIEFVAGVPNGHYVEGGRALGLLKADIERIANSADSPMTKYRAPLLKAAGIL